MIQPHFESALVCSICQLFQLRSSYFEKGVTPKIVTSSTQRRFSDIIAWLNYLCCETAENNDITRSIVSGMENAYSEIKNNYKCEKLPNCIE